MIETKYYLPHTDAQSGPSNPPPAQHWATLSDRHRAHLLESALTDEAIEARGYFTVGADANGAARLRDLGFDAKQSKLGECLVIPLHNWRGEVSGHAIRPTIPRNDTTTGKPRKYELATGSTNTLDVSVLTRDKLADLQAPLLFTEGAKKADSAASRGLVAISLNGVYGLRGKNLKGGIATLAELDEIAFKGTIDDKPFSRRVLLAFDSDWEEKDSVYNAMRRVAATLESRGATVKMVSLPSGPNNAKVGLDDYFANGGTVAGLHELARDLIGVAEREKQKAEAKKAEKARQIAEEAKRRGVRPIETNGRQLVEKLEDLSDAVSIFNERNPQIFHGMDGLVYVSHDALGSAGIKRACRAKMQTVAGEAALWVSTSEREGVNQVSPPRDLCENFLVSENYWRNVPPLERVATAPFFAPDGTLCDRTGYYRAARSWLALPPGFETGDTTPNPDNIAAARQLILNDILGEVAFANDASRAHAVALMLLPFARRLIDGPTPLHLWNAPLRGSGKSYSAELCISPFTVPSPQGEKGNAEEWRKSIFTKLVTGPSHVFLDNIKGSLNSSTLDMAITSHSGYIEERLTGTGDVIKAPVWCVWVATANNAQLTEDAASRSIVIEIDPNCENPDKREFKGDPASFIRQNRGAVCGAILTLIRAWIEAGRPNYGGPNRCRFPLWRDVMGGILEVAEISGFLDNIETSQEAINANQSDEWHELTESWWEQFESRPQPAKELLPLALKIADLAAALEKHEGAAKEKAFSQILARKLNRVYGEFKIQSGPKISRKATFKLILTPGKPPAPEKGAESADVADVADVSDITRESQQNFNSNERVEMKNGSSSRIMRNEPYTSATSARGLDVDEVRI
jgi:hypothetical protein